MTEPCDLDDLFWDGNIWSARRGDVTPLIAALRSDRPLGARDERKVRDFLASLLAGEIKQKRGPKRRLCDSIFAVEFGLGKVRKGDAMACAEDYVRALKMCAKANGKVRGAEEAAIKLAVREYGVSEVALHRRLHQRKK
jgi:hypothetical protein